VRPWIAGLLTFLGWGLGLYYARNPGAWRLAWFGVLIGIVLAAGVMTYVFVANGDPQLFFSQEHFTVLDTVGFALSALVAILVWRTVAKQQSVQRAAPARLFGYLAIIVVPLLVSLSLAMALRFGTVQPFRQASGSMQPTLLAGQYILASKWSYGYSRYSCAPFEALLPHGRWLARQPARGDIVVFRPTPEPDRDFVKRIVGLPGDRIQMIDGVLHINGTAVTREPLGEILDGQAEAVRETLPNGVSYVTADRGDSELDNTREFRVPDGHYFVMGDDRDNSADSRIPSIVGYVPFDNLIGRVDVVSGAPAPAG
jgi:signal peptidase I